MGKNATYTNRADSERGVAVAVVSYFINLIILLKLLPIVCLRQDGDNLTSLLLPHFTIYLDSNLEKKMSSLQTLRMFLLLYSSGPSSPTCRHGSSFY